MNKQKAVVILSGGLDSTTLLHYVKSLGFEVYGLSFDYGQRHKKELEYAKYWGLKLCKEWKLLKLDFMKEVASNSALINNNIEVPHDKYDDANQKITVVPFRNGIMLSVAVAWAENIGAKIVFYGAHANDSAVYPDCRPGFADALSKASVLGTYNSVRIIAPFVNIEKWQVLSLGLKLGVDYSKTWSCYEGDDKACGLCGTCQERIEAFKMNGVKDPIPYKINVDWGSAKDFKEVIKNE